MDVSSPSPGLQQKKAAAHRQAGDPWGNPPTARRPQSVIGCASLRICSTDGRRAACLLAAGRSSANCIFSRCDLCLVLDIRREELSTAGDGSALLCLICYLGEEKGTFWSFIDPRTSGRFITALTFRRAVTATLAPNNGSTVINHTGLRVFGPPRTLKHYLTQVLFICVCMTAAPILV